MLVSLADAKIAKAALAEQLAKEDLVNGIGLTRGDRGWAVQVNLTRDPPAERALPSRIEGVEVVYDTIGPIRRR